MWLELVVALYSNQIAEYKHEFLNAGENMYGTSGLIRYDNIGDWLHLVTRASDVN